MINWDKPIQTRDGRKARVICRDRIDKDSPSRKNLCLITQGETENTLYVDDNGRWQKESSNLDIINVPEEHEVIAIMCRSNDPTTTICYCLSSQGYCANECKIAFTVVAKKKITIREGEGLEITNP